MIVTQIGRFLTICETKRYSEAADKLGVIQSILFKQVKAMEDELFIKVFNKDKKRVKLTEAGKILYPYIVFMYGEYEEMIGRLQRYSIGENVSSQPGGLYFTEQYDILQIIKEFGTVQSSIKISMDEYRSSELEETTRTGKLDTGFAYKEPVEWEYRKILPIREDYLAAVVNKNHHLALRGSMQLSELKAGQSVLIKGDEGLYKQLLKFCIDKRLIPKEYNMDIRLETTKELISTNGCVTVLMRTMAEDLIGDKNPVVVMIEDSEKLTLSLAMESDTKTREASANYIS